MRWRDLSAEAAEHRHLPGYAEPASVRTFDAPEALDVRFYEVHAKTVLNRVPKASRVPFPWTINPYRGCLHACSYCLAGGTPILMGDGRTKRLADVRAGDVVLGTVRRGRYRRYARSRVLAHWSTIKPAYRIALEDGTELVASGDHRFLTRRGLWKHVTDAPGRDQRPHLTLNDRLLGTGASPSPPEDSPDYRRGYLCGLIRGDGTLGSYSYDRPRRDGTVHRFRIALTDLEALRRARAYLDQVGVATWERAFASPRRPMRAIGTGARDSVVAVRELIRWPRIPRPEWCKGFLAGSFDAEGSFGGCLRIYNTDPEIIDWICLSLRALRFGFAVEDRRAPAGLRSVRLLGGPHRAVGFLIATDPAISRKRSIEGTALEGRARLGVESIEPLGRAYRLYDITTETGDFVANGVVSHNCFARPTHTYLGFDAGRDFEREIVVKVNAPEVARAQLMRPSWKREHVAMGTNTDPYQWVEGRYRLMPGIWEALRDSATPCSVLTKSPLLLRDKELMRQVGERAPITANLSIPTLDERAWRATEPHTPNPYARIEAVAELNRAGIPTGVLIAPLIPGVNDEPEQVARIVELCGEAGAVDIGGIALHLRGEVRELWFDWLREHRPDLLERYERLYARGAYAAPAERERLARLVKPGGRVVVERPAAGDARARAPDAPPAAARRQARAGAPPTAARPQPEQSRLF